MVGVGPMFCNGNVSFSDVASLCCPVLHVEHVERFVSQLNQGVDTVVLNPVPIPSQARHAEVQRSDEKGAAAEIVDGAPLLLGEIHLVDVGFVEVSTAQQPNHVQLLLGLHQEGLCWFSVVAALTVHGDGAERRPCSICRGEVQHAALGGGGIAWTTSPPLPSSLVNQINSHNEEGQLA